MKQYLASLFLLVFCVAAAAQSNPSSPSNTTDPAADSLMPFPARLIDCQYVVGVLPASEDCIDVIIKACGHDTAINKIIRPLLKQKEIALIARILSQKTEGEAAGLNERLTDSLMTYLPAHPWLMSQFFSLQAYNNLIFTRQAKVGKDIIDDRVKRLGW